MNQGQSPILIKPLVETIRIHSRDANNERVKRMRCRGALDITIILANGYITGRIEIVVGVVGLESPKAYGTGITIRRRGVYYHKDGQFIQSLAVIEAGRPQHITHIGFEQHRTEGARKHRRIIT